MTPERFFQGRFSGFGSVQALSGRTLRRFTVEMEGSWSEEHRALYLEERYAYVGREDEVLYRSWVIHSDEQGYLLGHDAHQAARLVGRVKRGEVRLTFDRPSRPGGPTEPRQRVRMVEVTPTHTLMLGRITVLGLPIAFSQAAITRHTAPVAGLETLKEWPTRRG